MKRINKSVLFLLVVFLTTAAFTYAQEKKSEQHIKIVAVGKDGKEVKIDTVISSGVLIDSIKLKDGKVFYIGKGEGYLSTVFSQDGDKDKSKYITVKTTVNKGNDDAESIQVITGDTIIFSGKGDNGKVVIVKGGKHFAEGKGGDVMVWSSTGESSENKKVIYINEGGKEENNLIRKYDIEVKKDGPGASVEKLNYVIAKDGFVVTIEGGDEAKVREIADIVESKLGVSAGEKELKPIVKEEAKKTVKK